MPISYVVGDATYPQGDGLKIVAHISNISGGWGKGFVLALSARWPEPEQEYRKWHHSKNGFVLGNVQLVKVADDIIVANMLAQHGYSTPTKPAIRYDALRTCLEKVAKRAKELGATIHAPRLGAGLAGGTWGEIEPIILETMGDVEITIYDFEGK